MELMDFLQGARKSLFRFEYLQEFEVGEDDNIQIWKETNKIDESLFKDWWDFLEGKHKKGVITQRVRRVVYPPNEYTQWELAGHRLSVGHGDDIREISDSSFKLFNIPAVDFWLIDDEIVLRMQYSDTGKYLGIIKEADSKPYVKYKELLLNNSNRLYPEGKSYAVGEFDDYAK